MKVESFFSMPPKGDYSRNLSQKKKLKIVPSQGLETLSSFVCTTTQPIVKIIKPKQELNLDLVWNKQTVNINEYDIFHIDLLIKERLIAHIGTLSFLYKKLNDVNIDNIRTKIQESETTFALTLYTLQSSSILEQYKKLLSVENCFVGNTSKTSTKNSKLLDELTQKYINIAREYVIVENYERLREQVMECRYCEGITVIQQMIEDDSTFVCMSCCAEIKTLDDAPTFKDADRVNMANRYTYSRKGHFVEAMKKYQGKHSIDTENLRVIRNILLSEIQFHGLTIDNVTKDHIYMFLAEKRYSIYYDDINLLFHIITGKPCPDFSNLEAELLDLFEQQEKALDDIMVMEKNNRINSINVYYKLYKLLQKLGFPCRKCDFYILKTKTKEDEHDEKMRQAWIILGWEWIET